MQTPSFDALLAQIYHAAVDPNSWPAVMSKIGQVFGANVGAVMFVDDAEYGRIRVLGSPDRDESIRDYLSHWSQPDEACSPHRERLICTDEHAPPDIARAAAGLSEGAICTDDMVVSRDALQKTAFYNDHLAKFDFYHAVAAKIWDRPAGNGVLSVSRAKSQGAFAGDDLRALARIVPHLQHAFGISQRLAWAEVGGAAGAAEIERTRCATFLLDQSGLCRHANGAAERMAAGGDGMSLVRGELQARDAAANDSLARIIDLAVRGDPRGRRSGGAVPVPRPSGLPPLAVVVAPMGLAHDWFLPDRPRAIVTVMDPDTRRVPTVARLQALFALTPSEAAVAIGIAEGWELKVVADKLRLTDNSGRQYLSRVYAKTHTTRQNDLTRLLALIGGV